MATVQGIRERIGQPVLDAFRVPPGKQLREIEAGSTLKFFVNVQGKTKLETNLQSASLLPHYNTFEARAMRVVISDLPPEFSDDVEVKIDGVEDTSTDPPPELTLNTDLKRAMELLQEARDSETGDARITLDTDTNKEATESSTNTKGMILTVGGIEAAIEDLERKAPPREQIRPNDGAGNIISKFIFNTVTTLFVGEKIMIEMPTWFFPGGAGPYSFTNKTISHGEPSPLATFRFAEPVFIDKQQNFRVEIDIPDSDVHKTIQQIYGPLFIWVVLDGYLTRDVQ
jgi:hypothetical protein